MRILEVAPAWFPVPPVRYGGIELVVSGLTDGLVAAGHDVTLVAAAGSTTTARLLTLDDPLPSELLGDAYVELPHLMLAYGALDRVELVHDHTAIGVAIAVTIGTRPVVHTLHGEWTDTTVRLCRALDDRATIVAISHDQARRAPPDIGIARVVHNGIPFHRYPFRREPAPGGHLAFLGRAGADKGADAAVEVARRLGRPLRLAIKVNEPDERAWWRDVLEPDVRDASDIEVVRDATHDEKLDVVAGAAALLCPLRWDEPFGLMMVEANACGTPVVAWARGAAPEVVVDGETGLLVAPDDLDAMCEATLAASSLDRAACRAIAHRRFSADTMVRGYGRVFDEVVERRRRRPGRSPSVVDVVDRGATVNSG